MNASTPPLSATTRTFTQLLSATRRGARLARLLAADQLRVWEAPPHLAERGEQIVAELAANAVFHGRVAGRDFRLGLVLLGAAGTLRVEVTDARGDLLPEPAPDASHDGETGRGLLLVTALADRWGSVPFPPGGKTVWAEVVCARR